MLSLSLLTNHIFTTYTKKPLRRTNTTHSQVYFSADYTLYFLVKEVFYTKLKYSRVPQFDTSAGAAASFLSGLFGFMVCEKFGFELIDSGDFLFAILYLVLVVFLASLIIGIVGATNNWGSDWINFINSFRRF
uniref:Uncharacterized protein n=1 Tax=Euplotes vannus TaxID=5939 RepID=A0A8A9WN70_EUPVA|nr:hypothetical protein [Euplotes vannus]